MGTASTARVPTGRVTPAPDGARVEQVGWGVARQVARLLLARLEEEGGVDTGARDLLALLPVVAERPGHLVHVLFERRTATAAGVVELHGEVAVHRGVVVLPEAPPEARLALVVRASHDAAAAGVPWLEVPWAAEDLRPLGVLSADNIGP